MTTDVASRSTATLRDRLDASERKSHHEKDCRDELITVHRGNRRDYAHQNDDRDEAALHVA